MRATYTRPVLIIGWLGLALALPACGGGSGDGDGSGSGDGSGGGEDLGDDASGGGDGVVVTIEEDDPRVSRSAGEEGGVVVMWPRIMGFAGEEAALLQQRLVAIAERTFPDAPLDVRPDPERVCPRRGCRGPSLGVLLVVQDDRCLTVALVGEPGDGQLTLIPWTGEVVLETTRIPFREPPESHVTVRDMNACADLATELAEREGEIQEALRTAMP